MLTVRRIAAIPLFLAGVACLIAGYGGGIALALYLEIHSWKLILDGDVLQGIVTGAVVLGAAITLVNAITIPGAGAIERAGRL
jgi:hypothetical protein